MRIVHAAALAAALVVPYPSRAQDYAEEAEARMGLSFDLDEVEGRLSRRPAPAAPYAGPTTPADPLLSLLPLEPNSDIDTVTVFRDRAVVTRVLAAKVDLGEAAVRFEGLPLGLLAQSLEGSVRAGAADIVGVEIESGLGDVQETERILGVQEEAKRLTADLGEVRDRIEALLAQRAYLRSAVLRGGHDAPAPALGTVQDTLSYVGEAERDIARRLREEEKQAEELGEELEPLLVKLDHPLATGFAVRVALDAEAAGEVTVALTYQVAGASWGPTYNARLDADADRVELEYYGLVSNRTGEDWKDASLLLSTARPAVSGTLPALVPWTLGQDPYGYPSGVQASMATGPGHFELAPSDPKSETAEGVMDAHMRAEVQGSGVVVFAIPGRRTVLGDGSAQRLPVGTQTLAATVALATVPKQVPEVYRRARIHYDGNVPLLPGPVSSYVGSDYVGSGQIAALVPGETLELSFGTEDRMTVTRQLVSRQMEYVGLGRSTVRYTFAFRIAVTNHSRKARTVEVLDQLPISQLEGIKVKAIALSDGLLPEDGDSPGLLRWRLSPAPGESEAVSLEFSVTAPAEAAGTYLREMELML